MLSASSKKHTDKSSGTTPAIKSWGIAAALLIVIPGFILSQIIAQIFVSLLPAFLGWDPDRGTEWVLHAPLASFIYVVLAESIIVGLLVWFIRRRGGQLWQAIGLRRPRWRDGLWVLLGFLGYALAYSVIVMIVSSLVPIDADQEQAVGFAHNVQGTGLVMAFISLVVLPPIVEEMLFRGLLFGTLRRRNVSFIWSTLIVSSLFAFMHLFGGSGNTLIWIAFLDTFVLSLVLCYVREKTGSIWASIGLHAIKNTVVFVNLFIIMGR